MQYFVISKLFMVIFTDIFLQNENWEIQFLWNEPYFFKINKYLFADNWTCYGVTTYLEKYNHRNLDLPHILKWKLTLRSKFFTIFEIIMFKVGNKFLALQSKKKCFGLIKLGLCFHHVCSLRTYKTYGTFALGLN